MKHPLEIAQKVVRNDWDGFSLTDIESLITAALQRDRGEHDKEHAAALQELCKERNEELRKERDEAVKAARVTSRIFGIQEGYEAYAPDSVKQIEQELEASEKAVTQETAQRKNAEAANEHLRAEVQSLREALTNLVDEIGPCICSETFTSRHMEDPSCDFHEYMLQITEAVAALAGDKG